MLRADVPGLDEKDISVEATAQGITLRGEKQVMVSEEYTAHRRERRPVRFARSIALPCKVDLEGVSASVRSGVLEVRAPKHPDARPKQITVEPS